MFYQGDADVHRVDIQCSSLFLSIKALCCSLACRTTTIYLTMRPIITRLGL